MPRTDEELEQLADKAESFDPTNARVIDATPIREITETTETIRRAQAKQREAVQVARARGIPWSLIAEALGTTRQSAHERFAEKVNA
jgi:hypothetical protein